MDNLIISHLFGAEEVTPFNIVFRVFNTLYSFLQQYVYHIGQKQQLLLQRTIINGLEML